MPTMPDATGHFGKFGGMFVPETLMSPLEELTKAYDDARKDPAFQEELDHLLGDYCGRPTPLYFAERWTEKLGGAKIYLKREDLLHTGAHKIKNGIGQILLAKRLGKKRIIRQRTRLLAALEHAATLPPPTSSRDRTLPRRYSRQFETRRRSGSAHIARPISRAPPASFSRRW